MELRASESVRIESSTRAAWCSAYAAHQKRRRTWCAAVAWGPGWGRGDLERIESLFFTLDKDNNGSLDSRDLTDLIDLQVWLGMHARKRREQY